MAADLDYVSQLEQRLGTRFRRIQASRRRSQVQMEKLAAIVGNSLPDEASFAVFGSLGRGEVTQGSDLDWCLVIDGRADFAHRIVELELKDRLKKSGAFRDPNPVGAFGALAFSHNLIHCIGGSLDTNANLTLRLLLLLESAEPGPEKIRSPRLQLIAASCSDTSKRSQTSQANPSSLGSC